jgi:hypothetical protein
LERAQTTGKSEARNVFEYIRLTNKESSAFVQDRLVEHQNGRLSSLKAKIQTAQVGSRQKRGADPTLGRIAGAKAEPDRVGVPNHLDNGLRPWWRSSVTRVAKI